MLEKFVQTGLSGVVEIATGGHYKVEKNPAFTEEMQKIEAEDRNLATRVYDSGTLLIIDDTNHTLIPKFVVRRK